MIPDYGTLISAYGTMIPSYGTLISAYGTMIPDFSFSCRPASSDQGQCNYEYRREDETVPGQGEGLERDQLAQDTGQAGEEDSCVQFYESLFQSFLQDVCVDLAVVCLRGLAVELEDLRDGDEDETSLLHLRDELPEGFDCCLIAFEVVEEEDVAVLDRR